MYHFEADHPVHGKVPSHADNVKAATQAAKAWRLANPGAETHAIEDYSQSLYDAGSLPGG